VSDVLYCSLAQSFLYRYREICAVCSQIHTKHINTLCGKCVELVNVELAIHQRHTKCFVNYARVMIFIVALKIRITVISFERYLQPEDGSNLHANQALMSSV